MDIIGIVKSYWSEALAVLAAAVAVWQALIARTQAKSAEESADFAERQALAAEKQLALARRQFDSESNARDEADGPSFQVEQGVDLISGQRFGKIPIKLLAGTALDTVIVSAAGQPDVYGFVTRVGADETVRPSVTLTDLAPGAAHTLVLYLDWNAMSPVNVRLDFECHEGGGGTRTWVRSYSTQVTDPPSPPTLAGRRRRLP